MRAISVSIWPRNRSASPGFCLPLHDAAEQRFGIGGRKIRGARRGMSVIRGRGAHDREERAALAMRGEISAPRQGVFAGERAELLEVVEETDGVRIDHVVGPVRRDHAALPATLANGDVMHRSSSGDSVVASASMLKRSNKARGRNSGFCSRSAMRS